MARAVKHKNLRGFLILSTIVFVMGAVLWWQGELINPLHNTDLILNAPSDDTGFAMVGERTTDPAPVTSNEEVSSTTSDNTDTTVTVEPITMETFVAELAAAGVDVEAVTATMTAEGRSLDNLLAVVNSGRVTVEDLATRLKGETPTNTPAPAPAEESPSLFDLRWDEVGSVLFDVWVILAVTVVLILVARPVGWLIKRTQGISVR